ncbi:MAG: SLC13 family permease [bacterium]|nr:SLC13 family permease [bacterium]
MKRVLEIAKKEVMLLVSLTAAVAVLMITPPSARLLTDIDWKTLAALFMMLTVLEGFKRENIFLPVIRLTRRIRTMAGLSLFLVFGVFFSSMFVTNDVSLIIFVPLTILLFRAAGRERYILPVISMENIAAIRGSMLMPFGSPQNLYLFSQSGVSVGRFILHMAPLCILSAVLLCGYVLLLFRKDVKMPALIGNEAAGNPWQPGRRPQRVMYLALFVLVLITIVTRTRLWPLATAVIALCVLLLDRDTLRHTDYVLLLTFLCFFVFSSSIAANPAISGFLCTSVAGREYWWSILLSQLISNVPASIVLYPFSTNLAGLLYGLDTAGLCSLIGSLASVINYRIYVREYPGQSMRFIRVFTVVSLIFFALVALPGYWLSAWAF